MSKKTKGNKKTIKIPENLHARLKELAARNRMYLDAFVSDRLWEIAKAER